MLAMIKEQFLLLGLVTIHLLIYLSRWLPFAMKCLDAKFWFQTSFLGVCMDILVVGQYRFGRSLLYMAYRLDLQYILSNV
jgi:hypothetical protein